ncbi:hypothetical protein JMJ35_008246 [Cladonia borealis]|uniref:ATPase inhibitor, mitochondrial n=1 Tax=Cladonia borealis TaxID=184061 RepID=A0AA39V6V2_9LECA|nr:hypothetical protein JMJ35_008246 [Cladonia borealis]
MLRQSLIQNLKPGLRSALYPATRAISTTAVRMGEGDTGATRSGGAAQGDAFSKRERASEDMAIREMEMQKLREMKAKIADHKKHLDELEKNM